MGKEITVKVQEGITLSVVLGDHGVFSVHCSKCGSDKFLVSTDSRFFSCAGFHKDGRICGGIVGRKDFGGVVASPDQATWEI